MLVLSRRRDESIVIGDNIVVTVVDIRGDKVRLGIDAPPEIPAHRQEFYESLQREAARIGPALRAPLNVECGIDGIEGEVSLDGIGWFRAIIYAVICPTASGEDHILYFAKRDGVIADFYRYARIFSPHFISPRSLAHGTQVGHTRTAS